jgi:hypothetical protein
MLGFLYIVGGKEKRTRLYVEKRNDVNELVIAGEGRATFFWVDREGFCFCFLKQCWEMEEEINRNRTSVIRVHCAMARKKSGLFRQYMVDIKNMTKRGEGSINFL